MSNHRHAFRVHCQLFVSLAMAFCLLGTLSCGKNQSRQNNDSGGNNRTKRDSQILENVPTFSVDYIPEKIDRARFDQAELKILFIGNSHTRDSPEQLGSLYSILKPNKKILIARSVGQFLVQHAESKLTLDLVRYGKWDYVVLQAQKYSTSGKYVYPTEGAEKLAAEANKQGAKVIMFPEWSRRGHPDEYLRINKIHESIAAKADDAAVAPIGQTWVAVAEKHADLDLLHPDGNHASMNGNFINACIFYSMIENESPEIPQTDDGTAETRQLENRIAKAVAEALGVSKN